MEFAILIAVSTLTPLLLEKMKTWDWCPLMLDQGKWKAIVNRATPLAMAAIVSSGVTWQFDEAAGRLVVDGLLPNEIVKGLAMWAVSAGVQQGTYSLYKKGREPEPDSRPGPRLGGGE